MKQTSQYFHDGKLIPVHTTLNEKQLLDNISIKYKKYDPDNAGKIVQNSFHLAVSDVLTYLKNPQPTKNDYFLFDKLAKSMMAKDDGYYRKQDLINICKRIFGLTKDNQVQNKTTILNNYSSNYFKDGKILRVGNGMKIDKIYDIVNQNYKLFKPNPDNTMSQQNFGLCIHHILFQGLGRKQPAKEDYKYFYQTIKPKKQNGVYTAKDMINLMQMLL